MCDPTQNVRYKHQEVFRGKDVEEQDYYKNTAQMTVGFLSENDPYEANAFEALRAKWIDDSKKLNGDFI